MPPPRHGTSSPGEIFRSENIVVRKVDGQGGGSCVVTFDSFTDFRSLDRTGFGEQFFAAAGVDAVHVIPRDNDWYQYSEMAEAMQCVRAATRGYARVVTYGSSMGAYAAIRFAGLAGAHAVLALSPQYSIDPAVVPWERRWPDSSDRFRNVWEDTLPFPTVAEAYVVYDPTDNDRKHIALLAKRLRFHRIGIPGGHPVTGYLADLGLLQESALAVCRGPIDAAEFAQRARARRFQSAQYLLTLTKGTSWRYRARRVRLMREAVRLAPENAGVVSRLGIVLAQAGAFEESALVHRRALALAPGHPNLMQNYSFSLEVAGRLDLALAVMEELDAHTGGAAMYQARLADLRDRIVRTGAPATSVLGRFSRAAAEAVRRVWPSRTRRAAGSRR